MKRGKTYRRINPPDWFRNFDSYWRPAVQWWALANWRYAGIWMVTRPEFRLRPVDINPPLGYVEWAGEYDAGVYRFGVKMRFQLKRDTPKHEIALRVVDNVGSLLEAHILVISPGNISASPDAWDIFGTWDVTVAGLFNDFNFLTLRPVRYSEEP